MAEWRNCPGFYKVTLFKGEGFEIDIRASYNKTDNCFPWGLGVTLGKKTIPLVQGIELTLAKAMVAAEEAGAVFAAGLVKNVTGRYSRSMTETLLQKVGLK